MVTCSSVTLGNTLNLVLLANGIGALRGGLGGIDDLVSESLGNALEGTECGILGTLVHQVKRLVDAAERGDIHSLAADNTTGADTGRILTGTSVGGSLNKDLDRVLASKQVDELKGLLDGLESKLLLTVGAVASDHNSVNKTFNEGALNLLEAALLVAAGSVGAEDLLFNFLHVDVVSKRGFGADNALVAPHAETFGFAGEFDNLFVLVNFGTNFLVNYSVHLGFKG